MHYAKVEKRGKKWSTLTNYFSTNFQKKKSPNFEGWCKKNKKIIDFPNIFKKGFFNIVKNLLGVLSQDKVGVKKSVSKS